MFHCLVTSVPPGSLYSLKSGMPAWNFFTVSTRPRNLRISTVLGYVMLR